MGTAAVPEVLGSPSVAEAAPYRAPKPRCVAPDGVLRPAGTTRPDVAGHDAGEQPLRVAPRDPELVQRRRVEESGTVAHGEVLVLRRHAVLQRRQVAGPVTPPVRGVELLEPLVERSLVDHRPPVSCQGPRTFAGILSERSVSPLGVLDRKLAVPSDQ